MWLICWKIINKLIVKNITSAESQIRISCIPYEHPKPLDYLSNILRNNRYIETRILQVAFIKNYNKWFIKTVM